MNIVIATWKKQNRNALKIPKNSEINPIFYHLTH